MRIFETERLVLRPVEEQDLRGLLELQWDKDIMKYMIFKPLSIEDQYKWFHSLGDMNIAFSVFLKQEKSQELIGLGTLNQIDHIHQRASWGMKLKSNLQKKGVGFEASLLLLHFAFSYLNLNKITANSLENNPAGNKIAEKIGTRKEGLLMKHIYQNGTFQNLVLFGILREEFYNKNSESLRNIGLINE